MSNKWDDMLIYHKTMEECHTTGTMKVHWVRKVRMPWNRKFALRLLRFHAYKSSHFDLCLLQFPFFCSNREYTIGRRIWKMGGAYYCVTKV
jgi:hypothetical protein